MYRLQNIGLDGKVHARTLFNGQCIQKEQTKLWLVLQQWLYCAGVKAESSVHVAQQTKYLDVMKQYIYKPIRLY